MYLNKRGHFKFKIFENNLTHSDSVFSDAASNTLVNEVKLRNL